MSFLEKNLTAMAVKAAAEKVRIAPLPAGFTQVIGTDGTPTFAKEVLEGMRRVEWLGKTSMPKAGAEAVIHTLDAQHVNGLGLPLGTGFEWAAFAKKLARHQALFVWEPDVRIARMALEICDLSELMAAGKLVLFVGKDLQEQLTAFLAEQFGYEAPTLLHPLPTLAGDERRVLLAQAEAAVQTAVLQQYERTQRAVEAMTKAYEHRPASGSICMWVTPAHAFERPWQQQLLEHALPGDQSTGLGTRLNIWIDDCRTASIVARLKTMMSIPQVIHSDVFAGQLMPHEWMPAGVRVETYLTADALPMVPKLRPGDRIIVQSDYQRAFLLEQGVSADAVEVRRPKMMQPRKRVEFGFSVALVGDLPAADAKSLGVELPSHVALYEAAKSLILEDPFAVTPARLSDLLRRIQHRASIDIKDESTRDTLARMLQQVLAPAFTAIGMARLLDAAGVPLTLIGTGWHQAQLPKATLRPWPAMDIKMFSGLNLSLTGEDWQRARFPEDMQQSWPDSADASSAFAGVGVVAATHWANVLNPLVLAAPAYGLPLLSTDAANEAFAHVVKPAQFVTAAKALLADASKRDTLAARARQALGE